MITYTYNINGCLQMPRSIRKKRKNESLDFKFIPLRKMNSCIRCRKIQFFKQFERFCKNCRRYLEKDKGASLGHFYDDCSKNSIYDLL